MSKSLFLKKFICNRKEIGSIIPSSSFLADKVIKKSDIDKSSVIIELGAGTGSFTKLIFDHIGDNPSNKKVFIIEKDPDLCALLIKKYPSFKSYIFNCDILNLHLLLGKYNVQNVDLVISGLPFKSLPIDIFFYLVKQFIPKYFGRKTVFVQFSYFKGFSNILKDYFKNVEVKKCLLNIPRAYVFRCKNFKK